METRRIAFLDLQTSGDLVVYNDFAGSERLFLRDRILAVNAVVATADGGFRYNDAGHDPEETLSKLFQAIGKAELAALDIVKVRKFIDFASYVFRISDPTTGSVDVLGVSRELLIAKGYPDPINLDGIVKILALSRRRGKNKAELAYRVYAESRSIRPNEKRMALPNIL